MSLHVRPGRPWPWWAPPGGGKSTLCQLIPRFYDVTEGAIRIDGQDVRTLTPALPSGAHRHRPAGRVPLCRHHL
ncbi:MAG: ATP-binding cassette domain-containing protein [Intestinimonas sp.]